MVKEFCVPILFYLINYILKQRLDNWVENCSIYVETKIGFRKGSNTVDSAVILRNIVTDFLGKGKRPALFVDYSGDFYRHALDMEIPH